MKQITQPLHLYSGPELEALKAGYEQADNAPAVALIAAELAIREEEYARRMKQPRKARKSNAYLNAA